MKTLVILAHPNLDESIANKRIAEQLSTKVENLEVRDIFKRYPDYKIDIEAEQKALLTADTVIFQYPFYWYNMPAILKVWFDEVFNYNFAYGSKGDKLKGKNFLLSFTIGGYEEEYTPTGYNHFRIEELVKPMEQTAYLSQMKYINPIYEYGMIYIPNVYNTRESVEEKADKQVARLMACIDSLSKKEVESH
jgi:putative NADPH-quinone reductase